MTDQVKKRGRPKMTKIPSSEGLKIERAEVSSDRLSNDDFYAIFQSHPLGHQIFCHLYTRFITNKRFDADPYVHAFNAGMAEMMTYIVQRCAPEGDKTTTKENKWSLE